MAATMQNSAASFVPVLRLVSPANTPSALGEQQHRDLGAGPWVWCYLKRYSSDPLKAPWSPAETMCRAVK